MKFLILLLLSVAMAGTNNLPTESSGVIRLSHVNKFKTALSGDFVPRDSSGNVVDVSAKLGTSTFRWTDIWGNTLNLKGAAGTVKVTSAAGSSNYTITLPPTLGGITAGGRGYLSVDDSGNAAFDLPKQAQVSAMFSGTAGASLTTWASVSFTGTGRGPVMVTVIPDASGAGSAMSCTGNSYVQISDTFATYVINQRHSAADEVPWGAPVWMLLPFVGTKTITLSAFSYANISCLHCILTAVEL